MYGNWLIFDDLAWQFHAYQASGIWALRYTSSTGLDVSAKRHVDIDTWNVLYQGDYSSDPTLIQQANLFTTQREQEYIVQPAWDVFHSVRVGTFLGWLAASPLSGGASFTTVVGATADITQFSNRWKWITYPTIGVWPQWLGYTPMERSTQVRIPLRTNAEGYSRFWNLSSTTYPIIW